MKFYNLKNKSKMEGPGADIVAKLKQERDWNMSCVFTDKETMIADNGCEL